MRSLYLFTAKFPYTIYTECFLEDEIKFLSKGFDNVVIIPLLKETDIPKELPHNCNVLEPLLHNKYKAFFYGLINFPLIIKLIPEFFKNHVVFDKVKLINWIKAYYIGNNLLNSKELKMIKKIVTKEDVCYFYWGKWSNLISIFWKDKCRMASRFHGEYDLWEEVHHNYVPLRKKVVQSLDCAFFISTKGQAYFEKKYPSCKTVYSPLGTNRMNSISIGQHGELRVLSCSSVIPLKRVLLIYQSLLEISDFEIVWTHIGGGTNFDELKNYIKENRRKNIKVTLLGPKNHEDVIEYYKNNSFDVFVNLSTIEGVPVSIMEAISCNIPVVATDVGGTSEIVTKETGVLVSDNPTTKEVANAIVEVYSNSLNFTPLSFWENHYDASKNYSEFVNYLYQL